MEEILASIRRIISEDEAPASAQAEPAEDEPVARTEEEPVAVAEPAVELSPEPAAAFEPVAEVEEEDDVLDLTDPVAAASTEESIGDLDVFAAPPAAPAPAPTPAAASAPMIDEDSLVSAPAAAATVSAFGQLAQRVAMPAANQTLDDVVRELLRPLLKEWLDQNLAAIVQAKVEEEVERLARRRGV